MRSSNGKYSKTSDDGLPAFTGYLQRCQSILQEGSPSSEVLLYFPFEDLIHDGVEKLPLFTVHNQSAWLHPTAFYRTAMELWNHGITFDYVSDALLSRATVRDGAIQLGSNSFKALVLPGVKRLAPASLEMLLALAKQGGTVIIQDGWPTEVPGFYQHEPRRAALLGIEASAKAAVTQVAGSILPALTTRGVIQEPMTASALRFVRRRHAEGYHYFIVNRSGKALHVAVRLGVPFESAVFLDPWQPASAAIVLDRDAWPAELSLPGGNGIPLPLHLEPGESIIVRTFTKRKVEGTRWTPPLGGMVRTVPLNGPWKLQFTAGGPVLPQAAELRELSSWTKLPDPAASNFSGTARYTTEFDNPAPANASAHLDLGMVCNTARVYLNGQPVGISWCPPRILDLSDKLKPGRNRLAIEVTNLAANRIADLDRRKVPWKRFHEINFVNLDYQPFDASTWPPLDSGLLGPVRLQVGEQLGEER